MPRLCSAARLRSIHRWVHWRNRQEDLSQGKPKTGERESGDAAYVSDDSDGDSDGDSAEDDFCALTQTRCLVEAWSAVLFLIAAKTPSRDEHLAAHQTLTGNRVQTM